MIELVTDEGLVRIEHWNSRPRDDSLERTVRALRYTLLDRRPTA